MDHIILDIKKVNELNDFRQKGIHNGNSKEVTWIKER